MKKRSLVAALAMLVVSAIVLTSSTYAWFATNNVANVETFSADVGNSAGSVYISATGQANSWKSTLKSADFEGIVGTLVPVTYDKTGDKFYGGTFGESQKFTLSTTANTGYYTAFDVYVYAEAAGTVTITPTLTETTKVPYVYASVKSDADQVILGTSGDSYFPVLPIDPNSAATATDNIDQNGIIDSAEAAAGINCKLGTEVEVSNSTSISIDLEAGENAKQKITVYIWAEGQDSHCVGTNSGNPAFNLTFNYVQEEVSSESV